MRKIIVAIVAVAMFIGTGGFAIAAETKAAEAMKAEGTITAVDAKANTFTMKTEKGDITCEIGADSKITAGKDSKTLADVKAGDKVECNYAMENEKHICKMLDIKPAAAK